MTQFGALVSQALEAPVQKIGGLVTIKSICAPVSTRLYVKLPPTGADPKMTLASPGSAPVNE